MCIICFFLYFLSPFSAAVVQGSILLKCMTILAIFEYVKRIFKASYCPLFDSLKLLLSFYISSVQFNCTVMSDSLLPHGLHHTRLLCPSPTPGAFSKLMSIESVMPSNHLILCHPLLLLSSIFPSIKVFSNESVLPIRWPKYLSFSFSISSYNEYSRSIPLRIDWFALLAVQGPLKSLLQHHSSKASIFQCSAFFMI